MSEHKIQKPFLKWVGGKTQIINEIISKIPPEMNNYHELFLGGGSVLLAVLSLQKQNKIIIKNKIYAYDLNRDLINVYIHIQNDKDELYKFIDFYIKEYDGINGTAINRKPTSIEESKTSKESYYYWVRNKYNNIDKNTILLAGGLNPENAQQAALVGCAGLDFNSGVESEPGKKDADKLNRSFEEIRCYMTR